MSELVSHDMYMVILRLLYTLQHHVGKHVTGIKITAEYEFPV